MWILREYKTIGEMMREIQSYSMDSIMERLGIIQGIVIERRTLRYVPGIAHCLESRVDDLQVSKSQLSKIGSFTDGTQMILYVPSNKILNYANTASGPFLCGSDGRIPYNFVDSYAPDRTAIVEGDPSSILCNQLYFQTQTSEVQLYWNDVLPFLSAQRKDYHSDESSIFLAITRTGNNYAVAQADIDRRKIIKKITTFSGSKPVRKASVNARAFIQSFIDHQVGLGKLNPDGSLINS